MEKFSCSTGRLILWSQVEVYSLLLIKDIPKIIKQGRRGEWKPRNKGRGCGREGARALKGWKAGEIVGNYSTMLIILLSKRSNAKKKRQTILLRSLELNIFKNSDRILEQKQNRHFLKNSSIVDRLQSQKKCKITKQFQHWIQKDLKWFYNPTISLKQILQTYDDINKTPDNRNLNQQYKRN